MDDVLGEPTQSRVIVGINERLDRLAGMVSRQQGPPSTAALEAQIGELMQQVEKNHRNDATAVALDALQSRIADLATRLDGAGYGPGVGNDLNPAVHALQRTISDLAARVQAVQSDASAAADLGPAVELLIRKVDEALRQPLSPAAFRTGSDNLAKLVVLIRVHGAAGRSRATSRRLPSRPLTSRRPSRPWRAGWTRSGASRHSPASSISSARGSTTLRSVSMAPAPAGRSATNSAARFRRSSGR